MITSCVPNDVHLSQATPQQEKSPIISTATGTTTPPSAISPTSTPFALPHSEGPLLLLQSDVDEYLILDIHQQSQIPIDLPDTLQEIDLVKHLSPSRTQLFLHTSDETLIRLSLLTGEVQKLKEMPDADSSINLSKAVEEVQQALPNLGYTEEGIQSAVKNTFRQSIQHGRWFDSDRTLLMVSPGSETSTNLTLLDIESMTEIPLEDAPGMVEGFWIGPGRKKVLLKKGYIVDPGIWQEDRYFIISIQDRTFTPLPIPEDAINPAVSWFSISQIGITHQLGLVGGTGFSLVDINTLETTQFLTGQFSHITAYDDQLLIIDYDQQNKSTHIAVRSQDGVIFSATNLDGRCSLFTFIDTNRFIMNCEAHSFLFQDDALNHIFLTDSLHLFSRSPDRTLTLVVTRNQDILLLDGELFEKPKPVLVGEPLEVMWLPDSSGFLYRLIDRVYHYDLESQANHLLLTSDFLLDYRNLNAVWIVTQ